MSVIFFAVVIVVGAGAISYLISWIVDRLDDRFKRGGF